MAILKYIGRRLLVLIPVLLGISLAAFLLGRIAPGDPVDDALFRIGIEFPTEEDRADMRAELGLDRPLPVQYLDWLGDALRGDLGRSYIGNKDIAQELMTRLPITLKVSLAAMLAAVVFGVGGGVLMAACHGTWLDTVLKGLSTLLLSVPGFWLALFLITVFAEWLHLLPTSGLDRGWPPWCCPPWLSPPPTWAPPPASPGATSWPNWGSSTSWWPTPRACPSGR